MLRAQQHLFKSMSESGSLMCQVYSTELSKNLMYLTNSYCREQVRQQIPKVRYIKKAAICLGREPDSDIWVSNYEIQLTGSGVKIPPDDSEFIWLGSMTGNRKLPDVAPATDAAFVPQKSSQQQLYAGIHADC